MAFQQAAAYRLTKLTLVAMATGQGSTERDHQVSLLATLQQTQDTEARHLLANLEIKVYIYSWQ